MTLSDMHTHTVFSDGADTPEEMVLAAISMGMTKLGFSDHSYTFFDESYCIRKERIAEYRSTIARLKEKFGDKLTILCGIEQDYYSAEPTEGYDYVIGSVHYLKLGEEYIPVDEDADILKRAADKYFGGDMLGLVERYYETVSHLVEKTNCSIIGHFDLITKFTEEEALFDTSDPRYVSASRAAADRLLESGVPFEINTGAVSRGWRTTPYPSAELRSYIASKGGTFIPTSDSHSAATLCFGFDSI